MSILLIPLILSFILILMWLYLFFKYLKTKRNVIMQQVINSKPVLNLSNSRGEIVTRLNPGEPGYNHFLYLLAQNKAKGSYVRKLPARSESDQLLIDRLLEQKGVLETLLIENGIILPSDAPKQYEAYSWRDKTIDDI